MRGVLIEQLPARDVGVGAESGWFGRTRLARRSEGIILLPNGETVPLSHDIRGILDEWEYEPDQIQVRMIRGEDGQDRIQMRIDLGLIQMELAGRPDGQRPHGFESLLESYEAKAQRPRCREHFRARLG